MKRTTQQQWTATLRALTHAETECNRLLSIRQDWPPDTKTAIHRARYHAARATDALAERMTPDERNPR